MVMGNLIQLSSSHDENEIMSPLVEENSEKYFSEYPLTRTVTVKFKTADVVVNVPGRAHACIVPSCIIRRMLRGKKFHKDHNFWSFSL